MKFSVKTKFIACILILVIVIVVTLFSINKTITSGVENKYQSYNIDDHVSLYENLQSIPDFSLFLEDLKLTDNVQLLENISTNLVVLVPTNAAYSNLLESYKERMKVADKLHVLGKIVKSHIFEVSTLSDLNNQTGIKSLNGQSIRIFSENDKDLIRDSIGNVTEFNRVFYKASNGYFAAIDNILLPYDVSFLNGVQIESKDSIGKNLDKAFGTDYFTEEQLNQVSNENITLLFSIDLDSDSNFNDYILEGKINTYQIAALPSVKTLSGQELLVEKSNEHISIGEFKLEVSNSNMESSNGFVHFVTR